MNKEKIKTILEAFTSNDTKLVNAFNTGSEIYGSSIERQLHFVQTRLLLNSSVLSQLLHILTEETDDGKIKEQTS